jgi:hypothetical protein
LLAGPPGTSPLASVTDAMNPQGVGATGRLPRRQVMNVSLVCKEQHQIHIHRHAG